MGYPWEVGGPRAAECGVGGAPRKAQNARKVSGRAGRPPPRKEAGGWRGSRLAQADLRADETLRPRPAAPSPRPSCSWGWKEELLGTRAWLGGTHTDQIGCGLLASSRPRVTHCHGLQVPHLRLEPGALETILGTTGVSALAGAPVLPSARVKGGGWVPPMSRPLSPPPPLTKPQRSGSGSGPGTRQCYVHLYLGASSPLTRSSALPRPGSTPSPPPAGAPAPLPTISSSSSSPGHRQTCRSPHRRSLRDGVFLSPRQQARLPRVPSLPTPEAIPQPLSRLWALPWYF